MTHLLIAAAVFYVAYEVYGSWRVQVAARRQANVTRYARLIG